MTGFVSGIHQWLVNSPHKGQVTRKMFPFDDVIMKCLMHHWPFVRGIQLISVGRFLSQEGPEIQSFDVFCVVSLGELLNKQSSVQLFEMPYHACDITVIFLSESKVFRVFTEMSTCIYIYIYIYIIRQWRCMYQLIKIVLSGAELVLPA